ncbi:response regulator transcription factor [Kitasatospora purpeofusca]|uniref:response regulator transcription factor n=1 Tax=Kitasatospora purpeofusca TaxID=67352 RepID=UPI0035E18D95
MTRPQLGDPLTTIETDVLRLAMNGGTTASIGRALHISGHTVNSRLKNAYDKLGVHDRPHAVAVALRLGILRLDDINADHYHAAIRQRTAEAEAALRAARQLHRPSGDPGRQVCPTCSRPGLLAPWPCATARALDTTRSAA